MLQTGVEEHCKISWPVGSRHEGSVGLITVHGTEETQPGALLLNLQYSNKTTDQDLTTSKQTCPMTCFMHNMEHKKNCGIMCTSFFQQCRSFVDRSLISCRDTFIECFLSVVHEIEAFKITVKTDWMYKLIIKSNVCTGVQFNLC